MFKLDTLQEESISLLKELINIKSFSFEEDKTASKIETWLNKKDIETKRIENNIISYNKYYDSNKPNILLNSHHDTVKPNTAYTNDPFEAKIVDGKLYGLGSNDAGGALVSLIALFTHYFDKKNPKYNLLVVASAEEEIAGDNSLRGLIPKLPKIDLAIVGLSLIHI